MFLPLKSTAEAAEAGFISTVAPSLGEKLYGNNLTLFSHLAITEEDLPPC